MEEDFLKIGKILKERRTYLGYTQQEIADKLNVTKSAVSKWESGGVEQMGRSTIQSLSKILDISPLAIVTGEYNVKKSDIKNQIPLLGTIAAGQPIEAHENIEDYYLLDPKIKADFCLRVKGDSMINVNIIDRDIVFIKKQSCIDNGEIGAILIDDTATLKRFYYTDGKVILQAENPAYAPIIIDKGDVRVLGKLVSVLRDYK